MGNSQSPFAGFPGLGTTDEEKKEQSKRDETIAQSNRWRFAELYRQKYNLPVIERLHPQPTEAEKEAARLDPNAVRIGSVNVGRITDGVYGSIPRGEFNLLIEDGKVTPIPIAKTNAQFRQSMGFAMDVVAGRMGGDRQTLIMGPGIHNPKLRNFILKRITDYTRLAQSKGIAIEYGPEVMKFLQGLPTKEFDKYIAIRNKLNENHLKNQLLTGISSDFAKHYLEKLTDASYVRQRDELGDGVKDAADEARNEANEKAHEDAIAAGKTDEEAKEEGKEAGRQARHEVFKDAYAGKLNAELTGLDHKAQMEKLNQAQQGVERRAERIFIVRREADGTMKAMKDVLETPEKLAQVRAKELVKKSAKIGGWFSKNILRNKEALEDPRTAVAKVKTHNDEQKADRQELYKVLTKENRDLSRRNDAIIAEAQALKATKSPAEQKELDSVIKKAEEKKIELTKERDEIRRLKAAELALPKEIKEAEKRANAKYEDMVGTPKPKSPS